METAKVDMELMVVEIEDANEGILQGQATTKRDSRGLFILRYIKQERIGL